MKNEKHDGLRQYGVWSVELKEGKTGRLGGGPQRGPRPSYACRPAAAGVTGLPALSTAGQPAT